MRNAVATSVSFGVYAHPNDRQFLFLSSSFFENTFQADGTTAGGGMRSSVSTSVKGRVVSSLSFRTVCKPGNSLEIEVEGTEPFRVTVVGR